MYLTQLRNYLRLVFLAEEIEDDDAPRLQRVIHPRINYTLHAGIFRQSFRVDVEVAEQVEHLIGRYLTNSMLNNALTPRQQILTALHFLGNDAAYHVNGQAHGVSKSTVFRCIHRVCSLITLHIMPLFVRWPTMSRFIERDFRRIAGFPNVKGTIDGTLVHMDAPFNDEPAFVGRDNRHSINVLLVCGPSNEFFFVCAKFPGSIHDARAVRKSRLWHVWEIEQWRPDNDRNSIILGDSAYPLTNWLMPPVVVNQNSIVRRLAHAAPLFERAHKKTRFIVECSIGILKEEFPCLNYFRIRNPVRITNAINACVALHNMQNKHRRGSYEYDTVLNRIANQNPNHDVIENVENVENEGDANNTSGVDRQRQILEYFSLHV